MTPFVNKLLDIAAAEVGVRETSPNRGQRVDEYHRYAGRDPALTDSWCAQFLYWCYGHAAEALGVPNPLPASSRALGLWERSPDEYRIEPSMMPEAGDVFIIDHGGGKGHCGLVVATPDPGDELIHTIEGNTSVTGARNGDGVYRRTRLLSEINKGYLAAAPDDAPAVA